ncbi:MAG: DoxX family protein [Gemmatimonadales bacterium]
MNATTNFQRPTVDTGLLVMRVIMGPAFMAHGAQKLFGWFGGFGLAGTGGYFETLGFHPGTAFALISGGAELVGGLLITLGFLGVVGPAMIVGVMTVAIATVHLPNGFFATTNGIELPVMYGVMAMALAIAGFGRHAVDAQVERTAFLHRPVVVGGTLGMSVLGAMGSLLMR